MLSQTYEPRTKKHKDVIVLLVVTAVFGVADDAKIPFCWAMKCATQPKCTGTLFYIIVACSAKILPNGRDMRLLMYILYVLTRNWYS